MTSADTANVIAGWSLWVAIGAGAISLLAAMFTGWQAVVAHRSQKAQNDRGLVEWETASWSEPEIVELRSKGPDDARHVWARLTIDNKSVETRARRIRQGETLRFQFPELAVAWEVHEMLRAGQGEQWTDVSAFSWGAVITWQSRYGRADEDRPSGAMRRRVRYDQEPNPAGDSSR